MDASYATPLSFTRFEHASTLSLRVWLLDSEEMVSRIRHDGLFTQFTQRGGTARIRRGRWMGLDETEGQRARTREYVSALSIATIDTYSHTHTHTHTHTHGGGRPACTLYSNIPGHRNHDF